MTDPVTNLHYAPNANGAASEAVGFNLADVSSKSGADALPAGVTGLVYLGTTAGATAAFQAEINAAIGDPKIFGFYLADEPGPGLAAGLKAEADYIEAVDPSAKTFIVEENNGTPTSPNYSYTPANTDIQLIGLDPYPIRPASEGSEFATGADYNVIPDGVTAAVNEGIPLADIVPVYQAFGGPAGTAYDSWTLPTAAQEQTILDTWGAAGVVAPVFDYAYSWGQQSGDDAIVNTPYLQTFFAAHNGSAASPPPPPPPVSPPPPSDSIQITAPVAGSTVTGSPVIIPVDGTSTNLVGDTVHILDNGTAVVNATVQSDGSWVSNSPVGFGPGSHTLTAEVLQGSSVLAEATDTFNVVITPGPGGGSPPPPPPVSPPPPVASGEVYWRDTSDAMVAWGMNGSVVASNQPVTLDGVQAAPNASWSVVGEGDFSGTTGTDLLWRNTSGSLVEWQMNGSQIASAGAVTMGGSQVAPDASWSVAGVGDFGTGQSDILWRNTNGTLDEWNMNGTQVTSSSEVTSAGSPAAPDASWSVAAVGNFGGGAASDVLWRDSDGSLEMWGMNGSVANASEVTLNGTAATPDASWKIAGVGDFNGDGRTDILWQNANGSLVDWTMNGSQIESAQSVTLGGTPVNVDASWQVAQIGDLGGGTNGVLWRNASTGAMDEWNMSGANVASSAAVTAGGSAVAPDASWSVQSKPTNLFGGA